jgi:alanyl-tRNA synthetase
LPECPAAEQMQAVEDKVNEVIKQHLDVTERFVKREEVDPKEVDLNKLPQGVSETLRLVYGGQIVHERHGHRYQRPGRNLYEPGFKQRFRYRLS